MSKQEKQHECIWCRKAKASSAFNREHVVPQSFGTFENNFVLNDNEVCEECNSFFARDLEPWLARDSLEGFDRYRYGLKAPPDFKSQGSRSTTRAQVLDGPFKGAWGYTVAGEENLGTRLFPQVGLGQANSDELTWFELTDLPSLDELRAQGFSGACNITLCECDQARASSELAAKGYDFTFTGSFDPPGGGMWIEHVFRPGVEHRRGLAKIALNYVAYQLGAVVARCDCFDEIRAFVMTGSEPSYSYYDVDEHPVVEGDKQGGKRFLIHAITLTPYASGISATVTLFNRLRHGFLLSQSIPEAFETRGHLFDIGNRRICELQPCSSTDRDG